VKPTSIAGIKSGDTGKAEFINLQRTVRTRTLETCIEE
jgi:hypothetical protein